MYNKIKKQIEQLKQMKVFLIQNMDSEYAVGQYNGIEYALSVLEQRDPEYAVISKEPEVREVQKEIRRTVASGKRRVGHDPS